MKVLASFAKSSKREAMINEIKGNLFEYLVAQSLAQEYGVESGFHQSIHKTYLKRFIEYEHYLKENDLDLWHKLPLLAKEVGQRVKGHIKEQVKEVVVIGKLAANADTEADILIKTHSRSIALSLKLCKEKSFVNTKSAGIKSFISKYFSYSAQAKSLQVQLTQECDFKFEEMARSLHHFVDLDYQGNFKQWVDAGYSQLPGELSNELRDILFGYYHHLIKKIYKSFLILLNEDVHLFKAALKSLCGFTNNEILQVTAFHYESAGERYLLREIQLKERQAVNFDLEEIQIIPPRPGLSSFELNFKSFILQIRVKPMNKFTAAAVKINCSVKKLC